MNTNEVLSLLDKYSHAEGVVLPSHEITRILNLVDSQLEILAYDIVRDEIRLYKKNYGGK